jgi:predicted  nucleic acid-binding Zn-ribbon protein
MDKMKKEEAEMLKSLQSRLFNARLDIGDIEVAVARLHKRKEVLVQEVETVSSELQNTQNEMTEKYGEKKVNLETGELS